MPTKRLLDARRSRKALPRGFGWIDHRLLRNGYLGQCSPDAQGLSYCSDPRIAELLA
jgi:hypothetical protein